MRGLHTIGRGTAVVLAVVIAVLLAGPAYATNVFVQVDPSTAPAGSRINVSANCDDPTDRQAIVQSDAFGRLVVMRNEDRILSSPSPNGGDGVLTGSVVIPGSKAAGDYPVTLECENGNTATTTLTVVNMGQPTRGPATGGGGTAGVGVGPLILAGGITLIALGAGLGLVGVRRRRV
ncbi:MAG TPA: hypothetical protein VHN18_14505 [Micromonosporaceae bacterium]|nr:hypothetical protein [Micromonosporaceae bacterium]